MPWLSETVGVPDRKTALTKETLMFFRLVSPLTLKSSASK